MITILLLYNIIETDHEKYASYNTNPDICKYLVEEGADLDSLEPTIEDGELM